jgi:uncharacterized protein
VPKERKLYMLFFAILVLIVFFAISLYIGYNGWVWLNSKCTFKYKKSYFLLIALLSVSFIIGRLLDSKILDLIGGYWMVVVGYSLIVLPIANILYFTLKKKGKFQIGVEVLAFFAFIFIYGSYNASNTTIRNYEVAIEKSVESKNLKVLVATDIHVGEDIGTHNLLQMVEMVKEQQPDIVLLAGDILNDDIEPFVANNIGDIMKEIKAPLGIYAVPGNHDYYGDDVESLAKEIEKIGIHFLRDQVMNINNQFYIVGRHDDTENNRKQISELVGDLDKSKPIIMLDHQPKELEEAQKSGVDMIVSGHTHNGQIAPANLITAKMYENHYGYLKKEQLHSFTSSGLGLWGPALRIGSQSEVMIIDVKFN